MMISSKVQRKFDAIWRKNGAYIQAAFTGSLPRCFRAPDDSDLPGEVPTLVFHSVAAETFEAQLRYLAVNGYKSVNADELLAILRGASPPERRTVALTFDDATGSFWAVAFPLLKKYQFKAILFVIPGLVPAEAQPYPNLEDVWNGRCALAEIAAREQVQPLCTWPELVTMQESGWVDIQAHSLTHSRIYVAPQVVDFVHPGFDAHFFANVNLPVSRDDAAERPLRPLRLGQPVYRSASRLSGQRRFLENSAISTELTAFVAKEGGASFFNQANWRSCLAQQYKQLQKTRATRPEYESLAETETAVRRELAESKQWLESQFNKPIRHFCYPWFQGSTYSDQVAAECGYEAVYYGLGITDHAIPTQAAPIRIRRISDEYIFCLPGREGRRSFLSIWADKYAPWAKKQQAEQPLPLWTTAP